MATYGRKKKSLLSSFSVFQDDKSEKPQPRLGEKRSSECSQSATELGSDEIFHHLVYTQLDKAKAAMKKSKSQIRLDSESPDELARSALLDDASTPRMMRTSTQDSAPDTFSPRSKSGKSAVENMDKPLPPIPTKDATANSKPSKQAKRALAPKTTNLKLTRKGGQRPAKLTISHPMLPQVPQIDMVKTSTSIKQGTQDTKRVASPQASTADAAELSERLTDLMQRNASEHPKKRSKRKQTTNVEMITTSKPSPLERSKTAFVKATRAITGRLVGSSEKPGPSNGKVDALSDSIDDLPHPETGFLPPLSRGRLERRIAEGENLGNPKIRDLMGQGNILRKPLPVYESMTALKRQSESMEDPFLDGNGQEIAITPRTPVDLDIGLDIDFSRHKNKRTSRHEGFPFRGMSRTMHTSNFEPSLSAAEAPSRFSNTISVLAQRPDVMDFSSSPVGFSTPRIRLEPRPDSDGKKRLTGVLVRSPSILDFSFEDYQTEEDDPATPAGGSQVTDHEHNLSVKRKSAKEDLRAQISPVNEKAERLSDASIEDSPTTEINRLEKQDHYLSSKRDTNMTIARNNREMRQAERTSMSDTSNKWKEPIGVMTLRTQSAHSTRPPSVSRPTSILFSRETRAHSRNLSLIEGDSMDIDELQADH